MLLSKSDFKYIARLLSKKPGFTLLSVLVLAGGLGISILVATVSYSFMFKTLPVENGERIFHICYAQSGLGCRPFKAFEFVQLRKDISTLDNVGIYYEGRINFAVGDEFTTLNATYTEWNMFGLSNTDALLGRILQPSDYEAGAEAVAVLAYALWQQQFNGDANILDSILTLQGKPVRVVGIMPEGYLFPQYTEIWLPVAARLLKPLQTSSETVKTYALLKNDISQDSASAEIAGLMQGIRQLYPPDPGKTYGREFFRDLDNADTGHIKSFPMASLGGSEMVVFIGFMNFIALCIFLLAAINVGTLLLARTNERIKDISIRVALGAPRRRLLWQTMGESIAISICGGLLAFLFAGAGLEIINYVTATMDIVGNGHLLPFWLVFQIDSVTLIATAVFLLLTIVFTSVIPCLRIINGDFNAVMRDGTRGALGLKAGRFSKTLVIVAVTIITFLSYVSAIAISQVFTLKGILVNIDGENHINAYFQLPAEKYSAQQRQLFFQTLTSSLNPNPAIDEVHINSFWGFNAVLERMDQNAENSNAGNAFARTPIVAVLDSSVLTDVRLLEGRNLDTQDSLNSPKTALISQSLAQRLWPDQSPVDQSIRLTNNQQSVEAEIRRVVGVVSETVNLNNNPFSDTAPMVYVPINQVDVQQIRVELVTSGQLLSSTSSDISVNEIAITALNRLMKDFDPGIYVSVEDFGEVQTIILRMINMGIFFGIGSLIFSLLIALTGIYGLTQNAVQLITQEIGTRRALGATDSMVRNLVLKRSSRQVIFGILIAMVITSPISYIVFTLIKNELLAPVFLQVAFAMALLFLVVYLAIYSPVRKVLAMEPGEALRYE